MASSDSLKIPSSASKVSVSVIDTTSRIGGVPGIVFMEPSLPGFQKFNACAYSFLITHSDPDTGHTRRILFDLGIRKDWTNLHPMVVERVREWGCNVEIAKNVSEILQDNGIEPASIEAVIWSHAHWDHIGDPSAFPSSVDLVVGPGIKTTYAPGFPEKPDAPVLATDFAGRNVVELSFENSDLEIGNLRALDYFSDGSFYLLDAPGHALGHINALARTTASNESSSFIYMAGDSFHHGSQLRPNSHMHLPQTIHLPSPPCPCAAIHASSLTALHPDFSPTAPFQRISTPPSVPQSIAIDVALANYTIAKIQAFDARPDVLVIAAHDKSILDILNGAEGGENGPGGCLPGEANDWMAKGWKEKARWRWTGDYVAAIEAKEKGEPKE